MTRAESGPLAVNVCDTHSSFASSGDVRNLHLIIYHLHMDRRPRPANYCLLCAAGRLVTCVCASHGGI